MAVFALLVLVVGNAASAFVMNYELLIVIRFLTGFLGVGTNYALAIAALSATARTERNFSIAVAAQVSVAIVGFLLLPSLISESGTPAVFVPLALIALALIPFVKFLPVGGHNESVVSREPETKTPQLIWFALGCQCVWFLGIGGVWAFVERIGTNAGISAGEIGDALALGMAVGLLGAFFAAALADRFGRVMPFAVAMLGQVLAVWWLVGLEDLSGLVIAICLYNGTWNFALPYLFAMAAIADSRGQLVVLMSTAQAVGLTFGATLAGAVIGRWGLLAVLWQGAGAALAALLIFVMLARRLRGVTVSSAEGS